MISYFPMIAVAVMKSYVFLNIMNKIVIQKQMKILYAFLLGILFVDSLIKPIRF